MKPGDRAIVTGDEGELDHNFKPGTEVIISAQSHSYPDWWQCEGVDDGEDWWVHKVDLQVEAIKEPTEAEVAALFGLIPTPHCETCTCHQGKP